MSAAIKAISSISFSKTFVFIIALRLSMFVRKHTEPQCFSEIACRSIR